MCYAQQKKTKHEMNYFGTTAMTVFAVCVESI
jgi:hypothetical protein